MAQTAFTLTTAGGRASEWCVGVSSGVGCNYGVMHEGEAQEVNARLLRPCLHARSQKVKDAAGPGPRRGAGATCTSYDALALLQRTQSQHSTHCTHREIMQRPTR